MEPRKDDDALVDLLDVILRDGVILRADVIISVAEIPLVGLKLTAALAGMETMTEYGLFEEWDARHRLRGAEKHGELEQTTGSGTKSGNAQRTAVPGPRPSGELDGRIGTSSPTSSRKTGSRHDPDR
ncbi:gas vesicle protein GvpA [Natrialba hulunbeirensis JCM 10989]|uniref:Gas vesicle protein GvpA n=1 Tax=Natrialba hulunbeirensis JCM 10989 TaxID=1227493 RepID=M0A8G1_9EURY|nr:gas vesicle protein [Natrialba hulunbeirensis]ELY95035.1 gas vesicle protein GvpA [Natrialba hulunbeirensis JCM 10989]